MQLLLADRQRGSNEKITHQFGKLKTTMKIPENCWEAQKFSKRYLGLRHQVQHLNFSCALHLGWSPHIQSGVLSTAPTIQGCGNVWNDRRYHVTNVTGIIPLQNPPGLVGCSPNRRWSQEVVLKLQAQLGNAKTKRPRGSDHKNDQRFQCDISSQICMVLRCVILFYSVWFGEQTMKGSQVKV